jgi:hypothetical protein
MTRFGLRDRVRRLPAGDALVHTGIFVLGLAFIVLGLVLSVLPGPLTIPPVLLGLVIWSLEFDFADRWVVRARKKAQDAWDAARAHPWRAGLVTGGGFVLFVVALVLASRYGWVDKAKDVITGRSLLSCARPRAISSVG